MSKPSRGTGVDFVHEVFDVSYRRLVVAMYAICGDSAEAEDAVQEAFVKAIARANHFDGLANPEAWLRTVALNQLRNGWRRGKLWKTLAPKLPGPTSTAAPSSDHVALVAALARLPRDLREVVVLHHIADLTVAEVAANLGIAEGTVKARLVRGRDLLAAALDDDPNEDDREGSHA